MSECQYSYAKWNDVLLKTNWPFCMQVIRLLVAILCVFFFSWGPNIVWETLYGLINTPQYAGDFVDAFYLLSYAHSALNPITYGFFSE